MKVTSSRPQPCKCSHWCELPLNFWTLLESHWWNQCWSLACARLSVYRNQTGHRCSSQESKGPPWSAILKYPYQASQWNPHFYGSPRTGQTCCLAVQIFRAPKILGCWLTDSGPHSFCPWYNYIRRATSDPYFQISANVSPAFLAPHSSQQCSW